MPGFDEVIEPDEASGTTGRRSGMFSGFGVPQLVAGMMIAAFALRTTGAAA
jgi:hypothetical protein